MKVIEIVIAPDGTARLETRGFAGADCRSASAALEALLGRTLTERPTAEFYQATVESPRLQEPS